MIHPNKRIKRYNFQVLITLVNNTCLGFPRGFLQSLPPWRGPRGGGIKGQMRGGEGLRMAGRSRDRQCSRSPGCVRGAGGQAGSGRGHGEGPCVPCTEGGSGTAACPAGIQSWRTRRSGSRATAPSPHFPRPCRGGSQDLRAAPSKNT